MDGYWNNGMLDDRSKVISTCGTAFEMYAKDIRVPPYLNVTPIMRCLYCGSLSDKRDSRGNCCSCGAPLVNAC